MVYEQGLQRRCWMTGRGATVLALISLVVKASHLCGGSGLFGSLLRGPSPRTFRHCSVPISRACDGLRRAPEGLASGGTGYCLYVTEVCRFGLSLVLRNGVWCIMPQYALACAGSSTQIDDSMRQSVAPRDLRVALLDSPHDRR